MPPRATLAQRVEWRLAHAKACGCRAIPRTVREELAQRGVTLPKLRDPTP